MTIETSTVGPKTMRTLTAGDLVTIAVVVTAIFKSQNSTKYHIKHITTRKIKQTSWFLYKQFWLAL